MREGAPQDAKSLSQATSPSLSTSPTCSRHRGWEVHLLHARVCWFGWHVSSTGYYDDEKDADGNYVVWYTLHQVRCMCGVGHPVGSACPSCRRSCTRTRAADVRGLLRRCVRCFYFRDWLAESLAPCCGGVRGCCLWSCGMRARDAPSRREQSWRASSRAAATGSERPTRRGWLRRLDTKSL